MTPLLRYSLLQVPGIVFLGALLWWVIGHGWMRLDTAAWIMGLWLIKDAVLYPLYKPALENSPGHGTKAMEGRYGRVVMPLEPRGQIRVSGELWAAVERRRQPIPGGSKVLVVGADGLTLLVEAVKPKQATSAEAGTAGPSQD
ncbi:membrane protein implicated in regulation of membrane protease activity [Natronocella acetinitrilica]|uniref:Membrane protein implicated in regulation of membrane protease activity n=1 Tax=Natronocella acetinitrilica TaxID=414046 RepID=A0AAE3KFG5_9GAMM|nr:NfeD family protein [Natronocella acetinitrilica]MCP1674032.1 membrane protein implicated in regulation of membrane protease activity [Natronocella acetinitrilica]